MNPDRLLTLLARVAQGEMEPADAARQLSLPPVESLPFATIDHHRALRHGYPEVIFGSGKTSEQIVGIAERLAERNGGFLVTRLASDAADEIRSRFPAAEINELGRTAYLAPAEPAPAGRGVICIVTAGTSDLPVAEEAAVTARALGNQVARVTDVGVSGIHRLLARSEELVRAAVVIVIAGMEGALPSVVGGVVGAPVIAVPTSVGYGTNFGGLTALFAMLNSCASGVTVVNIDNGFGAAFAASRITHA